MWIHSCVLSIAFSTNGWVRIQLPGLWWELNHVIAMLRTFTSISTIGVAFILSDAQDLLMAGEEQVSKRIQKFINIHRNSFLILSAALHGPEEWNTMFRIQRRYDFNIEPNFLLLGRNEVAVLDLGILFYFANVLENYLKCMFTNSKWKEHWVNLRTEKRTFLKP